MQSRVFLGVVFPSLCANFLPHVPVCTGDRIFHAHIVSDVDRLAEMLKETNDDYGDDGINI